MVDMPTYVQLGYNECTPMIHLGKVVVYLNKPVFDVVLADQKAMLLDCLMEQH
jgi:hypothetical protein